MQKERAKLIAAAPELLNLLKRFVKVSENFNNKQFGEKYPDAALTYVDAKKLIESLIIGNNESNKNILSKML